MAAKNRKTLGLFFNGVPDFENLFPLVKEIVARDHIDLKITATSAMLRAEPRIKPLCDSIGLRLRVLPNRLQKIFYRQLFGGVDAVLVLGDPATDTSAHGKKHGYIETLGLPCIYLQHGVLQVGVNLRMEVAHDGLIPFYSQLIFFMEEPSWNAAHFSAEVNGRIEVSGFVKQACFPVKHPSAATMKELQKYRQRVLFCHTFRLAWQHDDKAIDGAYVMFEEFAKANPDVALIIRSHRGKQRAEYNSHDKALSEACPNVYFSFHHSGPLKGLSITDALAVSDVMVSTPSTAILDAVYLNKPAAIFRNDSEIFAGLPQITDTASLEAFSEKAAQFAPAYEALRTRYGDPDQNIAKTARRIETFLGDL